MLFRKTDLQEKLSNFRNKSISESKILEAVHNILQEREKRDEEIEAKLKTSKGPYENQFVFDELETERIFHISHIKNICTDYRLRFLDSKYFKGKIPKSAITEIGRLEQLHKTQLHGFKIMAPSKLFKLEDKDDPLLFAPIGNEYYYLIHKWGNDLHPFRKILVWPFKGIVNLTITTLIISYMVTLLIPNGLFSKNNTSAEFWMMYFFMFKSIAAIVIFYGFALGKNFNPAIWNSKYYNA